MTRLLFVPLVVLLLTGCASTSTAPTSSTAPTGTLQAQCENAGGQWRGGMCEKTQGGGGY